MLRFRILKCISSTGGPPHSFLLLFIYETDVFLFELLAEDYRADDRAVPVEDTMVEPTEPLVLVIEVRPLPTAELPREEELPEEEGSAHNIQHEHGRRPDEGGPDEVQKVNYCNHHPNYHANLNEGEEEFKEVTKEVTCKCLVPKAGHSRAKGHRDSIREIRSGKNTGEYSSIFLYFSFFFSIL